MALWRYLDENCVKILRKVDLDLASGADVAKACRAARISDALRRKGLNAEGAHQSGRAGLS